MVLIHSNGMSFIENLLELNSTAAYLYQSVLLDEMFESRKGKPSTRPIKGFGTPAFALNYNGCTPFNTKKLLPVCYRLNWNASGNDSIN